jgi:hypothetical protein
MAVAQVLEVRMARLTPTHHRLTYRRPDGTGETIELESRSTLYHDLLHFAFESEAKLRRSFYGHLADAASYAQISEMGVQYRDEIMLTEKMIGIMTGWLKSGKDAAACIAMMEMMLGSYGDAVPSWFTPDFAERVRERMRRLVGEWSKLRFGQEIVLRFELADGGEMANSK